jgi:uncharacterized LabA/DUF88 family protein
VGARTIVYVDGFNLYHRALKDTAYKWLNLMALAKELLEPHNQIVAIKYYTARVSGQRDITSPRRQATYLAALSTIPELEVIYGHFLAKTITRPLVRPVPGLPKYVDVHTMEEKGSDVNLAVHLVNDAWRDAYDVGVVISNDSDLSEAMRIARVDRKKVVGLLCPVDSQASVKLKAVATFTKHIGERHLRAAQFPDPIRHPDGRMIAKPAKWCVPAPTPSAPSASSSSRPRSGRRP